MSHLFMLNSKKLIFSTYYNDKTFVIVTPDVERINTLHKVLHTHKKKYNKWLNNTINYIHIEEDRDVLDLSESNTVQTLNTNLVKTHLDVNNDKDIRFIHQLYELSNIELFLMYDFEYIEQIPLLSLHGIQIKKPNMNELFEKEDFLNRCFDL